MCNEIESRISIRMEIDVNYEQNQIFIVYSLNTRKYVCK